MKKNVKGILIILASILILTACSTAPAKTQTNSVTPAETQTAASTESKVAEAQQTITETSSSTNKVSIENFAFAQKEIRIKVGDTVEWENKDNVPHTVTSDTGSELSSQTLRDGNTFSHTFTAPGVYEYHCAVHPSMTAKVIVE